MGFYYWLKNLICALEPGAENEFQQFEDFISKYF